MPRATNAVASRRRRKKVLKDAKGYKGGRSRLFRTAVEAVRKGRMYAFAHRRKKKGDFRALWIARIGAAAVQRDLNYNGFISGLKKLDILLNRKMLADIAVNDPKGFDLLVEKVASNS